MALKTWLILYPLSPETIKGDDLFVNFFLAADIDFASVHVLEEVPRTQE